MCERGEAKRASAVRGDEGGEGRDVSRCHQKVLAVYDGESDWQSSPVGQTPIRAIPVPSNQTKPAAPHRAIPEARLAPRAPIPIRNPRRAGTSEPAD